MHTIEISPEIAARAMAARGGRPLRFGSIDPAKTAHLIVDMQNGFVEPGATIEVVTAREIVPTINQISRAVRQAGAINVFIRFVTDAGSVKDWSTFYGGMFIPIPPEAMIETFKPGSHGHAVYAGLDVTPEDLAVDKTRFGAFSPAPSALHDLLQSRGIETLIVTGTATNGCCETTAREAMQNNYRVIFVSDATAALSDIEHNAALNSLTAIFADVVPTETVLQLLFPIAFKML